MSTLAIVGPERQIHLGDAGGVRALTLDPGADPLLRWGQPSLGRSAWSWPTWSPDGSALACFELPSGDDLSAPARVQLLHTDGVRQTVLLESSGRVPIHACWRPDGGALAVLLQDESQLSLVCLNPKAPGAIQELEAGAPLYFSWSQRGLLVHARGSGPDRVIQHLPSEDRLLPGPPGPFSVPLEIEEDIWHVQRLAGQSRLVCTPPTGPSRTLQVLEGRCALVADAGELLLGQAPLGQGTPYQGVERVHASGLTSTLTKRPVLAFYPVPGAEMILTVSLDSAHNCLLWHSVDASGQEQLRAALRPSRETLWSLQFFEQFAISHPPLDARGERFVICGHQLGSDPRASPSQVFVVDLHSGGGARPLCDGSFACFSPS